MVFSVNPSLCTDVPPPSEKIEGNGNTIIVGDSQTSLLPIFYGGGGTSAHRLSLICPGI